MSFHGGYFALRKRKALQLLALGIPDEVKTSPTIAYSRNDTMDEMLVGIVCIGYCGKYIIPSRKVSEVAVAGGCCCQLVHVYLVNPLVTAQKMAIFDMFLFTGHHPFAF